VAVWRPGMAWPTNTPGGAWSPRWGGYVKLFVRCAIGAGNPFHMGPHNFDRLNAGNVLGGGALSSAGDLWVDIACDVTDIEVITGATTSQGILSKPDAGTITVTISDPGGIYDPLNPGGPFAFGGRSRLVPGTPVEVFAEVVDGDLGTVTTHYLFTGTADSWQQDWTTRPNNRETKLVASDATKMLARLDRPEQPAVGAGDTTSQRVHRIVDFFGWVGTVIDPPAGGTVTLQATTLAQSAWELLNRTLDDELGYVYITAKGELRWLGRSTWSTSVPPSLTLGCGIVGGYDILIDATPSALDRQMRNAVYAARAGGVAQSVVSASSIDRYGRYDYTRTDLGLADDSQAANWATTVVTMYAYPQVTLDDVTMRPDVDPKSWKPWRSILALTPVTDIVRVHWSPPDIPTGHVVDVNSRVFGITHTITRAVWEVKWQLVNSRPAALAGAVFTMGPHPQDRLDSNFVMSAA
jgi:hypothetical protein